MKNIILPLIVIAFLGVSPQIFANQKAYVVTVVDTLGRPIQGAEVSAWEENIDVGGSNGNDISWKQLINPVETDVSGKAQIQFSSNKHSQRILIFAQKAGFSIGWDSGYQRAKITEVRIVLDRINSTGGIVTDQENRPIAGAEVVACPIDQLHVTGVLSHLHWLNNAFTTTTDHEGRFSFDSLAEWMEVGFSVQYPGLAYRDTALTIDGKHLPSFRAGQKDIHITMYPASRIKGRILSQRGKTIGGIQLIARGENLRTGKRFSAVSDSKGYFAFNDLPPDTYFVTTDTGTGTTEQQLTAGARVEVELGETVENVKIRLRDPVKLDIIVKNIKTNQPVANALVEVQQGRISKNFPHLSFQARTNNQGIARVIVLPGIANFYTSCENYDYSMGEYLVRSTDTQFPIGITPYSTISGQAIYEDGSPAAGVEVAASLFEAKQQLTDGNGRFRMQFSESMAQRGFVTARDTKSNMAGIAEVSGQQGPVKIILKKAATLKGQIKDPDGDPIARARINVFNKVSNNMPVFCNSLYSDEEGRFTLPAVPYEQNNYGYRISSSAYGYSLLKYKKIDVGQDMGDIIELSPFVLKPRDRALSGTAVYKDGSAAAYMSVHVHEIDDQPQLSTMTDADGKFRFEGVCEGWCNIQCGGVFQDDCGFILAKGGDRIKILIDNNRNGFQLHSPTVSIQGKKLPMYELLTKDIEDGTLENKKLLVCFWWVSDDKSGIKTARQLTTIREQLDQAGIYVILVHARPFLIADKWLKDYNIPFMQADLSANRDVLEFRRAIGATFLPHMILTDENKIVTHEGFDIQWIKDNIL